MPINQRSPKSNDHLICIEAIIQYYNISIFFIFIKFSSQLKLDSGRHSILYKLANVLFRSR